MLVRAVLLRLLPAQVTTLMTDDLDLERLSRTLIRRGPDANHFRV